MKAAVASHVERTASFLERLRRWVEPIDDVRALVIIGSVARGEARRDSDVDVLMLTTHPTRYMDRTDWVSDFGVVETVDVEDYGRVRSVRVVYGGGGEVEVEFGIGPADWASVPIDSGSEEVARGGMLVLMDRDGHASALARAVKGSSETLEIVPYDPGWPGAFAAERDRIAAVLGAIAVRIDHHGSTAVPGLAAKPVIDIQVSVRRLQPLVEYAAPLVELGYVHVPHADDAFCPFFHRPAAWPHTHHVHVVEAEGAEERRTLAFRDYLREHPEAAREYEQLKRTLAPLLGAATFDSRQAYADAKSGFVTRMTERALAVGLPRTSLG